MAKPTKKNKDDLKGTDPKKNVEGKSQAFDPKALGDEDFAKIFDDPRVWQHKRFKELTELAKEAKKLIKAEDDRKEKDLEENKKFQELADKRKAERDEAQTKLQQEKVNNALLAEASKAGVVDVEATLKLIDRDKVTVDDDGKVSGVEDAVKTLIEDKPFLKGEGVQPTNIGSGTNPGANLTNVKKFTLSQVQNPEFYQEHRDDIQKAYKTPGAIIDDSGQTQE